MKSNKIKYLILGVGATASGVRGGAPKVFTQCNTLCDATTYAWLYTYGTVIYDVVNFIRNFESAKENVKLPLVDPGEGSG